MTPPPPSPAGFEEAELASARSHPARPFGWGIVGPGRIAGRFAEALRGAPGAVAAAVWARDPARARRFAQQALAGCSPAPRVHASLADLLADPQVDAVYIATPHDSHAALAQACLQHGKPVLFEKPLTPSLRQTEALVALAQQRRVFLMEALWTRFLPALATVRDWLRAGRVGEVVAMESSFCFEAPFDPHSRLFNPALAGGALLDIGIYNLAVTRWVLQAAWGDCPEPLLLQAQGLRAPTGVDQRVHGRLVFERAGSLGPTQGRGVGVESRFSCAFDQAADNGFCITGTQGEIHIDSGFWGATGATLLRPGLAPLRAERPWEINGFEYQIREAMRCIDAGLLQSPGMPHAESRALARWLDALRRQMGVRYPFEEGFEAGPGAAP